MGNSDNDCAIKKSKEKKKEKETTTCKSKTT